MFGFVRTILTLVSLLLADAAVERKRNTINFLISDEAGFLHYPNQYIARRGSPKVIDGDVFKEEWRDVKWSSPFVEIRGASDAPNGTSPTMAQSTRIKMMWDDEYLYIVALMDVMVGESLIADYTERNSPIYHKDSDFEIFVDPAGCCHDYKELELNAINTVWNLLVDKPYADGGREFSGRIAKPGQEGYWDVAGQKTAARITRGALQSPQKSAQWSVEVALAHKDTLDRSPVNGMWPAIGKSWRINFSRVEKKGSINWVWSPQIVWDPSLRRYAGKVNMHLPDAWGYVVFADADGKVGDTPAFQWQDPTWPARHAAAIGYYACKAYESDKGSCPTAFSKVEEEGLVNGADIAPGTTIQMTSSGVCSLEVSAQGWKATISSDRLLRLEKV